MSAAGKSFVDEEAGEDSDGGGEDVADSSDEDVDDDEQQLRKEGEGFIVDEEEAEDASNDELEFEEDDAQAAAKKRKKKRKKRTAHLDLDEEDLDLVEENTGQKVKRHKRLFKKQEAAVAPVGRDGMAREFGGANEYEDLEDLDAEGLLDDVRAAAGRGAEGGEDDPDDPDDEMGDFIEHDGPGGAAEHRATRRALAKSARAHGISTEVAQELLEVFGHEAQTREMLDSWYATNDGGGADADAQRLVGDPEARQQADPTLIERFHMTEEDHRVRHTDCAERLLPFEGRLPDFDLADAAQYVHENLFVPGAPGSVVKFVLEDGILEVDGPPAEELGVMCQKYAELRSAADWWQQELEDGTRTFRDIDGFRLLRLGRVRERDLDPHYGAWATVEQWHADEEAQENVRAAIQSTIGMLFFKRLEVPLIAMFHKEHLGELLATREFEVPQPTSAAKAQEYEASEIYVIAGSILAESRRMRRWDILWAIYREAFRYFDLLEQKQRRKAQLDALKLSSDVHAELLETLDAARSMRALDDWASRFQLVSQGHAALERGLRGLGLDAPPAPRHARPLKQSRYHTAIENGIGRLTKLLAVDTEHYAESVDTITAEDPGGIATTGVEGQLAEPDSSAAAFLDGEYSGTLVSMAAPRDEQVAQLLEAAAFVLEQEVASHPVVRAKVRELVRRHAVVSTLPTEVGEQTLDPFHLHGAVKRIVAKPAEELLTNAPQQWLHMVEAEKAKLITVALELPAEHFEHYVAGPLRQLYLVGVNPSMFQRLYAFRAAIVDAALRQHLMPMALRELRAELRAAAERSVLTDMGDAFWREATMPPLRLKAIADDEAAQADAGGADEFVQGQRTCVVCYGDAHGGRLDSATHMVMLDARGYPVDLLQLPQFSGRIPASKATLESIKEDTRKAEDAEKIIKFLSKHWPHLIVIGACSPECKQLLDDFLKICNVDFSQEEKNEHLRPLTAFTVKIVRDNVAALYETSAFAESDLKEMPRLVRRAVALGRACSDPLAVLAALLTPPHDELLSLQLHPLQASVPRAARRAALEELLITAVAQVGVCINACAAKDWLAPLLQFVPGLGPRKAAHVLKAIRGLPETDDAVHGLLAAKTIVARDCLLARDDDEEDDEDDSWRPARVLGRNVYKNAAPYLRVREPNDELEASEVYHVRDNLRMHPVDEGAVVDISCAALDMNTADAAEREEAVAMACGKPDKVLQVNIAAVHNAWAAKHPEQAHSKLSTFLDLSMELAAPYGDVRAPERVDLDEEEQFWALTGESPESLREGRLLTARVMWVQAEVAGLKTDSGVVAMLERVNANTVPKETLVGNLAVGTEVTARILAVDFSSMRLQLTSKSGDLQQSAKWEYLYLAQADPFYRSLTEREIADNEASKRARNKRRAFQQRPIKHPRFANITAALARSALENREGPWSQQDKFVRDIRPSGAVDGDVVYHPSSKGADRLGMSIRLITTADRVIVTQNIDLMETKSGGVGSHLQLGTPLRIEVFGYHTPGELEFEDLDEVLVAFAEPYCHKLREICAHKKFVTGPPATVDAALESRVVGDQPDYRLGMYRGDGDEQARNGPGVGWGMIAYKLSARTRVQHVPFRVSHKGFYVRFPGEDKSVLVRSVQKLVDMFKRTLQSASARKRSGGRRNEAPPPPAGRASQQYGQYTGGSRAPAMAGGYAGQYGGSQAVAQGQYGAYTQGY